MEKLASYIDEHRADIIEEWMVRVRALPSSIRVSDPVLRDELPELLDVLVASMRQGLEREDAVTRLARSHAVQRFDEGYLLRQVVEELRVLRRVVMDCLQGFPGMPKAYRERLPPIAEMNQTLDLAFVDAVTRYQEERDRGRDIVIGVLGHDLRNPVAAAAVSAQLIARRWSGAEPRDRELLEVVVSSTRRAERMISDLLDFARTRFGGELPVQRGVCDLTEVVRRAASEVRERYPERDLQIEDGAREAIGSWDQDRLVQVVVNLLVNAVEHGQDPIRVTIDDRQATAVVEVSNGGQLPVGAKRKLFEPFTSGDPSRRGLGLGLYIVREIVQAHEGTIEVRSEADRTRFRVCLPRFPGGARRS